ncbi:Hypothetical protein NTJ_00971 [Nesidiocoris tenuis]|uniref:Ionotropic glutamate receptor C-terminal domain-containing protein n=1 Tax=Nesidiocoris tenuis TaxID=355587 RepID=A0ABN7A7B2_9HEMI|nr:Hypothetical protein NTJ_00971 [Nesidiocoris tenuis]
MTWQVPAGHLLRYICVMLNASAFTHLQDRSFSMPPFSATRVVAVVALQTASLMSLVKLGNVNSKSRVLLITEEKLTDESTSLLTQVVHNLTTRPSMRPKFLWINVFDKKETFSAYERKKETLVVISQEMVLDYFKEEPDRNRIPDFFGENVIVSVGNSSIVSYLEQSSDGIVSVIDGFELRFLRDALVMMNLNVTFRSGDWELNTDIKDVDFPLPRSVTELLQRKTDIAAGGIFFRPLGGRLEFTNPWDMFCVRYLVPRPKILNYSSQVLAKVFHVNVWAAIAAAIILMSVLANMVAITTRSRNHANYRNIPYSILWTTLHFLQLYSPLRSSYTHSMYPLLLSWGLFGYLVTAIYNSELAAIYTKPFYSEKIQTESQFLRHGFYWGSDMSVDWNLLFDHSDPDIKTWTTNYYVSRMEERQKKLEEQRFVLIGFTKGRLFFFGDEPKPPDELTAPYEVADSCALHKFAGVMFPSGSPYVDGVNLIQRRLISAGIFQKDEYDSVIRSPRMKGLIPKGVFTRTCEILKNVQFVVIPLSVLYGPLCLLFFGYFVSIVVFCMFEFCSAKCKRTKAHWRLRLTMSALAAERRN